MKKEMLKRLKGWIAFVLCFGMLFGNSMMVLAANTYTFNGAIPTGLQSGTILTTEDTMTVSGGYKYAITYSYNSTTALQEIDNSDSSLLSQNIWERGGFTRWMVKELGEDGQNCLNLTLIPVDSSEERTYSGGKGHKHSFEWYMTTEPTRTEDGESSYICRECGFVAETQPATRWQWFMKQYRGLLKDALQNTTVTFEADDMPCISDYMLSLNAARPDVTTVIHFTYEGVKYELTIPAGTDFSAIQNDTDNFYGYLGLAAKLGLTANVIS